MVPNNSPLNDKSDIFLTYRNFGSVSLWGADLALDMVFGKHLSLAGGYSFVNKDFFPKAEPGQRADRHRAQRVEEQGLPSPPRGAMIRRGGASRGGCAR